MMLSGHSPADKAGKAIKPDKCRGSAGRVEQGADAAARVFAFCSAERVDRERERDQTAIEQHAAILHLATIEKRRLPRPAGADDLREPGGPAEHAQNIEERFCETLLDGAALEKSAGLSL
jgi:hypothetical protein